MVESISEFGKHLSLFRKLYPVQTVCMHCSSGSPYDNRDLWKYYQLRFRLDYLLHANMILCFACIWLLGKIKGIRWFQRMESLKYSIMVLCIGIGLEWIQILVPWRSFNPMDMVFNIIGAVLVVIIVHLPIYREI